MVAGVYVPPRSSCNLSDRYADVLAGLAEAVGRLQLAHGVPHERVLLTGDFNAHVRHLPCGLITDPAAGNVGGPRGARW